MAKKKSYWLVLNDAPYTKHKTLATARKAGQRLANGYPDSAKIEIWDTRDVDALLNLTGLLSFTQAAIDKLGVSPVDVWE